MMNLTYDVFNLLLSYVNNPQCVLVSKEWSRIIMQQSKICTTCNKITKMHNHEFWSTDPDDVTCHMHAHYKSTYKILDVAIVDIYPLKKIFDKLKKLGLTEVTLEFKCDKSIYINILNAAKSILLNATLKANYFNKFISKTKNVMVAVEVQQIINLMKCLDNNCEISLIVTNDHNLKIKSYNTECNVRLMDLPLHKFPIPSTQFDASVTINSKKIIAICNNLSRIDKYATIELFKNKVFFSCQNGPSSIKIESDAENKTNILVKNQHESHNLLYAINSEGLSNEVKLWIKKDFPLCIEYGIKEFGKMTIFVVPVGA